MSLEAAVRLIELALERVGPFDEARLRFLEDKDDPRKVAWLTGENGTGKTVVIDAIRAVFGEQYARLERDLSRPNQKLRIEATFDRDPKKLLITRPGKPVWGWVHDHKGIDRINLH